MKVVGKCSDGQVDHDGDIVSPAWMASAVKEWLGSYPALRMAHRADYPAGRGLEAWQDDQGSTYLRSLVVDGAAKAMVRKGVLRAYSIGVSDPDQRKSSRCPRWEIVGGRLIEVSLVDSPSNARCGIEVCKSVGGRPQYVGKAWGMADRDRKVEKHLRKAAELLGMDPGELDAASAGVFKSRELKAAEAAFAVEKALRVSVRAALDSADPWQREMAWKVLHGQD